MVSFILNNREIQTDQPSGMSVLDFIRYQQKLTGTKIGCREGDCGACTVLVGKMDKGQLVYQSMTSCLMPLGNAQGKHIVSIEGLNLPGLNPIQQEILDQGGTQCGFCTVGFVVSLMGFCLGSKDPTYENAVAAMDGNICRCTGYKSLQRAGHTIAQLLTHLDRSQPINWLIERQFIPSYFNTIGERLPKINKSDKLGLSGNGRQKVTVGGGTDLFVQQAEQMVSSSIYHIFNNPQLKLINRGKNRWVLGGGVTSQDIMDSPLMEEIFPEIKKYMKLVSSTPIRYMGTVAGNFANASPIGDMTIFFLALDSTLLLSNGQKQRQIKLKDFYLDYKKLDKKPQEQIESLSFEIPSDNWYFNFEKVSKRTHLDIASVNSAASFQVSDGHITTAHLSAGGVAPVPKYLGEASQFLSGKEINAHTIEKTNEIAQQEISPISDARGSKDYKRFLLRQLLFAHFLTQFPELVQMEELV